MLGSEDALKGLNLSFLRQEQLLIVGLLRIVVDIGVRLTRHGGLIVARGHVLVTRIGWWDLRDVAKGLQLLQATHINRR